MVFDQGFLKVILSNGGLIRHILSIPTLKQLLKPYTKHQKAEKERKNSTKDILVALEQKITKGALQEYRDPLIFRFSSKFLS